MNEQNVDRQTVKPGGKCRLTQEGRDFTIELKKRFLGQIFSLGSIPGHPQTQRIDTALMQSVQSLKRFCIALFSLVYCLCFRDPRCKYFLRLCQESLI